MSRRAAIVEEFDDDTDLPLPSQPLPNTGTRGPLLEEIHISDDEFEPSQRAGPASPSSKSQSRPTPSGPSWSEPTNSVTDITPYKSCVWFISRVTILLRIYVLQMDVYLSNISRRETSVWHGAAPGGTSKELVVASEGIDR